MNLVSRSITGIVMVILGVVLIVFSFFGVYFLLIYGALIFILGLFILFNTREDYVEPIKRRSRVKGGRKRK